MSIKTPVAALLAASLTLAAVGIAPSASASHSMMNRLFGPSIQGSGTVRTQTRTVGAFDAIRASDAIDLDLRIGPQLAVTVEADDNLLDTVRTQVRGGTLVVDSTGHWSSTRNPVVHVTVPVLGRLETSGSGDANLQGLAADALEITLNGSGKVAASGTVRQLDAAIEGSGDADLKNLVATRASVRVEGSGDATVSARELLDATIDGSGNIRYVGPLRSIAMHVNGSGEILRK
jgi:hypothetical protein